MKKKILLIAAVLSIIALLIFLTLWVRNSGNKKPTVTLKNTQINVELAKSPYEQQTGLMGRKELKEDDGMLFIFKEPEQSAIWMANMLIPLDIMWLDEERKIIYLQENATPCEDTSFMKCYVFMHPQKDKYVLEVNAGWIKKHNVKLGDQATWNF